MIVVLSWAEATHVVDLPKTRRPRTVLQQHKAAFSGRYATACQRSPRRVAGAATYPPDSRVTCPTCRKARREQAA